MKYSLPLQPVDYPYYTNDSQDEDEDDEGDINNVEFNFPLVSTEKKEEQYRIQEEIDDRANLESLSQFDQDFRTILYELLSSK